MKFCTHCGTEVLDEAVVCPKCGCSVDYSRRASGQRSGAQPDDAPNAGYGVLGFFIPVVGLILYLVWQNDYPLRAKSAGKGALISVIVGAALLFVYFIILALIIGMYGF